MLVSAIIEDVREVLGKCNLETLYSRISDAIEVLAAKGHWDAMLGYIDICASSDGKNATLPRDIETPLAVNVGGQPAFFRNKWFEFALGGGGTGQEVSWAWDDRGFFPTIMDIIQPSYLVAVADLKVDHAVVLRVYGTDENGKTIRSQDPDGIWSDGYVIPINQITDFPAGVIYPDDEREFRRHFTPSEINMLISATDHEFVTGAMVTLDVVIAPLPTPLVNGGTYYIGAASDTEVSLHSTLSGALTGTNPIVITSADASTVLSLTDGRVVAVLTQFETSAAHRFQTGMIVQFSGTAVPTPLVAATDYFVHVIDDTHFTAHATLDDALLNVNPIDVSDPGTAVEATGSQFISPETKLTFSVNHNFLQGDAVQAQNATGTLPEPLLPGITYFVRYLSATEITLHNTLADATAGVNAIVLLSSGVGTTAIVKTMAAAASLGNANNITCPNHNLTLAGGDYVQFTTSGILPTPLASNTTYRAEPPNSADTFTVSDLVPAAINITDLGAGQLYCVLSRVMGVGFTDAWRTDTVALQTGDGVLINSTGTLPACTPALNPATTYYVRVIGDGRVTGTIELYDSYAHAINLAATTGRIVVNAVGTGDVTLVLVRSVASIPFSSHLKISRSTYLQDLVTVRFVTDGTLPAPLATGTDYHARIVDGLLEVLTTLDIPIVLTDIGVGAHGMDITRNFSVEIPTTLDVPSNNYSNGDEVTMETTGTLPSPYVTATDYYIRRISDDTIEIYDTSAHAIDTTSTTGRIVPSNTGSGVHGLVQILANIKFGRVTRVHKETSEGFISLYAWDTGRATSLTLLGYLYPDEDETAYRRIRLGEYCQWIRMRYRKRTARVSALTDWIPVRSKMALLMMIRSLESMRNDFMDQAKEFEEQAVKLLTEKETVDAGPMTVTLNFNNDIYQNSEEQTMQ